jgi:hypothetical protein
MTTTSDIEADDWNLIQNSVLRLQRDQSGFLAESDNGDRHLVSLAKYMQAWATREVKALSEAKGKQLPAEQVLAQTMAALTEADRHQFLLINLLEGLKRGEPPAKMVEKYNEIGLVNIPIEPVEPPAYRGVMPTPQTVDAQHPPVKPVGMIRRMLNKLASICGELIKIAIVAAKAISDHVKVKFKPVVGSAAFLPSLSFLLEPEVEGEVSIGDCFEGLEALFSRFAQA